MRTPLRLMRYLPKAAQLLREGKLPDLLSAVSGKTLPKGSHFVELQANLGLCKNLCVAWFTGQYRNVSSRLLLAVVAALVYFVAPLDVVPDWILGAGFIDDLAVLGWVLKNFKDELATFSAWRDAQPVQVLAQLEQFTEVNESVQAARQLNS